ncbi:MAG TPA: hypothetical protein VF170_13765, partial [Planctomycetaceae bacterium]
EEDRSPALRAAALRLLPDGHAALSIDHLTRVAGSEDAALRREAVRALVTSTAAERFPVLAEVAADGDAPAGLRADAVVGLAAHPASIESHLKALAASAPPEVAAEARRLLNPPSGAAEDKPSPDDLEAWRALVGGGGDAEAGWRVFFRPGGVGCSRCHTLGGRGTAVGPDLTGIGRRMNRDRLIESILRPGKEVAPQYVPWTLVTADGRVLTGLPVEVRDAPEGVEHFVGTDGVRFTLPTAEVETRQASTGSVMPEGLEKLMTTEELRDLLALLESD